MAKSGKIYYACIAFLLIPLFTLFIFAECEPGLIFCNPLEHDTIGELLISATNKIILLLIPVIVLAIVFIGFKMVLAGRGNAADYAKLKAAFGWSLVGLFLVLGTRGILAVIQNTIDEVLEDEYKIENITEARKEPQDIGGVPDGRTDSDDSDTTPDDTATDDIATDSRCPTCVKFNVLEPKVPCKGYMPGLEHITNCTAEEELSRKLASLQSNFSNPPWLVTEGFPPVGSHEAPCHKDGTCVDINFLRRFRGVPNNAEEITAYADHVYNFTQAAKRAGLDPVYEINIRSGTPSKNKKLYDALKKKGVTVGGRGTGNLLNWPVDEPHFSVYKK